MNERLFNEVIQHSVTIKLIVREIEEMFEYNDFSNMTASEVYYTKSIALESIIHILARDGYMEVKQEDEH